MSTTVVLEAQRSPAVQLVGEMITSEMSDFTQHVDKIMKKVVAYNVHAVEPCAGKMLEAWMENVLENNLGGGKMIRGLMVSMTYKCIVKRPTRENIEKAHALGWVIEIIQSASLIADDMMDYSETRRGKPCWYKNPDVQMSAVNDSFLAEMLALQLLKIYFEKEPYYRQMYNTIHHVLYLTVFGQSMDCLTERGEDILECYTMERYDAIVKHKTGYYTMYAPVILAMIMAGKGGDTRTINKVEQIMLKMGHFFQVQDDFLDCFGDPEKTGKVGTDIQDRKCSWLFVKAVQLCSAKELEYLLENYGREGLIHVKNVKRLYRDLDLEQKFHEYEDEAMNEIKDLILSLQEDGDAENDDNFISPSLFFALLTKLYRRVH